MHDDLAAFLGGLEAFCEDTAVWGNGRFPLQITYYLCSKLPPLRYVSSVRAVVFRADEVLTLLDGRGDYYIVPGGRCENGEAVEATLRRELLEETGWTVRDPVLFSVIHFHHLSPKPNDHPYPHPDFLQLVYVANADEFRPEALEFDQYVIESAFRPISETYALLQEASQLALLSVAVLKRGIQTVF